MGKYPKKKTNLLNKILGISLLVLIICAVGISPIFASTTSLQNSTISNPNLVNPIASTADISVTTDKLTYDDGDLVKVTGFTQDYMSSTPVTLMIVSPIGNIVKIDQVSVGPDRSFSITITATGTLWKEAGAYTVKVQFGSKDRTAETTFHFSGSTGAGPTMKVEGTDFNVQYSITNGQVLGIRADTQAKSLMVSLQTKGDGMLKITLPRGLIDSKTGDNTDAKFIVLADGQESIFEETGTTTSDRTLWIPFTDGTTEMEIIGTFVIPEFGTISAMILVIAIASIVAISRTRLQFGPRC